MPSDDGTLVEGKVEQTKTEYEEDGSDPIEGFFDGSSGRGRDEIEPREGNDSTQDCSEV